MIELKDYLPMLAFRRSSCFFPIVGLVLLLSFAFADFSVFAQTPVDLSHWPSAELKAEAERQAGLLWDTVLTKCGDTYYYAGSGLDNVSKTGEPVPFKNGIGGDVTRYEGVRMFVIPPGKGTAASRENAARSGVVDGGIAIMAATTFSSGSRLARKFGPAGDGPLSKISPSELGNPHTFAMWYGREFSSILVNISGAAGMGGYIRVQMQKDHGEWKFSLIGITALSPRSIFELNPEQKFSCQEAKPIEILSAETNGCEKESSFRSKLQDSEPLTLEIWNKTADDKKIYSVDRDGKEALSGTVKPAAHVTAISRWNTFYVVKDGADRCVEAFQTKSNDSIFYIGGSGRSVAASPQCGAWTATGPADTSSRVIHYSAGVMQGNLISSVPAIYPAGVTLPGASPDAPVRVVLSARIGADGHVRSLSAVTTPSCELAQAAISAVSQWVYKPGPAAVETLINIDFQKPEQHAGPPTPPTSQPSGSGLFQEYLAGCNGGDGKSCVMVAYCYGHGKEGVDKSPVLAKQYYDKACTMGNNQGCRESRFVKLQ